ncbi:MAG: SdiA-regulated domain-containing protein, partial [Pseudomonadota bacterium]
MYVAKRKSLWLLAFVIVATLIVYVFKLEALGWYYWHAYKHQATGDSLHLKDYQIEIDGLRIPELADASGFTHNTKRNTLFTVLNRQSQIVELDLTG